MCQCIHEDDNNTHRSRIILNLTIHSNTSCYLQKLTTLTSYLRCLHGNVFVELIRSVLSASTQTTIPCVDQNVQEFQVKQDRITFEQWEKVIIIVFHNKYYQYQFTCIEALLSFLVGERMPSTCATDWKLFVGLNFFCFISIHKIFAQLQYSSTLLLSPQQQVHE